MMIGGRVIELRRMMTSRGDAMRVWCINRNADECAIYVALPEAEPIAIGDHVWWQGRTAYWTAQGGKEDVPLSRIHSRPAWLSRFEIEGYGGTCRRAQSGSLRISCARSARDGRNARP